MVYLLDVNVLLAMSWPGHQFHDLAQRWFARVGSKGWATCPIVETSFVRIISNPAFSPRAVSPLEAIHALEAAVKHPGHEFWADDLPAVALAKAGQLRGHQQVSDAYLLALSIHHHGRFATLDQRIATLLEGLGEGQRLELIK